jgi:hypothetical protein
VAVCAWLFSVAAVICGVAKLVQILLQDVNVECTKAERPSKCEFHMQRSPMPTHQLNDAQTVCNAGWAL